MPLGISSPELVSFLLRRVVLVLLLVVLQWKKPEAGVSAAATIPPIKLCVDSPDRGDAICILPCPSHRGDEENGERRLADALCRSAEWEEAETVVVFWSTSSVALHRPRAGLPLTFMAEWRLLRALVSVAARHHLTLNLLAGVPYGSPFLSFIAGSSVCTTPSGLVPGGGVDARDSKLLFVVGGVGPDRFLCFCFKVLYAKSEDGVVISAFFGVLFVLCNPTAED
jgi:hypothetical protein